METIKNSLTAGAAANLHVEMSREEEDEELQRKMRALHGEKEDIDASGDIDSSDEDSDDEPLDINPELLNKYGCPKIIQTPRVLLVRDKFKQKKGRQFADYNVLRRDALIAQFLKTRSDNIPIPTRVWNKEKEEPELVLTASSDEQAEKLLTADAFGPFKVEVVGHPTRNRVMGKIFDYKNHIEKNMGGPDRAAKDMKSQGVHKIIKLGKAEGLYKVSFNLYSRPHYIRLGRLQVDVEEFINPPLRCFRCQKYGHGSNWNDGCKEKKVCKRCGGEHDNRSKDENGQFHYCQNDKFCIHCKENHEVGSKDCSMEKKERDLKKYAEDEKITVGEAKRRMKTAMSERVRPRESTPIIQNDEARLDRMERMLQDILTAKNGQQNPRRDNPNVNTEMAVLKEKMDRMETESRERTDQLMTRLQSYKDQVDGLKETNAKLQQRVNQLEEGDESGLSKTLKSMEEEVERVRGEVNRVREENKSLIEEKRRSLSQKDSELAKQLNDLHTIRQELSTVQTELNLTDPEERAKAKTTYTNLVSKNIELKKTNEKLTKERDKLMKKTPAVLFKKASAAKISAANKSHKEKISISQPALNKKPTKKSKSDGMDFESHPP